MPNELKLLVAEELGIHDVIALVRTCRETNELFTRFIYGRVKDLRVRRDGIGRPYFLLAVDDGNLAAVERFVEAGASVNMTNHIACFRETAIHTCAYYGHVEIAEFLIRKGVDVSAADWVGGGVMHSLVNGMPEEEAMATLLVEAGAHVDGRRKPVTPLQTAAVFGNLRMVQRLLDLGANPNACNGQGSRPVHLAIGGKGSSAVVRCLLEAGQNVDVADHYGRTPLHMAALMGKTACVEVLLEMGADVSSVDEAGSTPLLFALYSHGNEASVHRILHLGASMIDRQPHESYVPTCLVDQPNHWTIETLLAAGSDRAKRNRYGVSPLTWAAVRAHSKKVTPQGRGWWGTWKSSGVY